MWTEVQVQPRPGAFVPPLNTMAHPTDSQETQVQMPSPKNYFPNSLHLSKLNSVSNTDISPFPIYCLNIHLPAL